MDVEPLILSEREAAHALRISIRHLQRLRKNGKIPFVRLGDRRIGYSIHAIERWVAEQTTGNKKREVPDCPAPPELAHS
ncbi:hypothetical protein THTE_1761 [Thermogutta terrifontis]|uniref:Helix-turn-helix domain-containing protein n=1 Tax=Thermogutta terrifontis TaxID=1331910 RepID=A0A286REJ1_9BACT|nr:helix-turn-helix domain-containing protein [Thermogutta terrifontis]ASV74363.1 hypothetical protein THTE_1761 [Thermogutta terrifontis]